ncbi:MAG: response regulator transcription factor [Clostridia bacterium]|nr:response regulator transcription factor [Clostridia bacterium]
MRILIVEDEFKLADVVASRLRQEKYIVDISTDGEDGIYNGLTDIYDLIILDVMLPKMNGFEVLRKLRANKIGAKIIMLTAKSMLEDKLNGFDKGANDYITKPFHIDELVARVNVQLRNNTTQANKDYIEVGDIKLNIHTSNLVCTTTGESIDIICKEFMLLEYLMQNPNQIISKERIYEKVWGMDSEAESNNMEAYISFVRKKLKVIGSNVTIKAVRGLGYRLEVESNE